MSPPPDLVHSIDTNSALKKDPSPHERERGITMGRTTTLKVGEETPTYIAAESLRDFVKSILVKVDVPEEHAHIVAEVLVAGDLRGVESHGVARLESYYISRIRQGLLDPRPTLTVTRETPVSIAIDGGNGLGHVASHQAMTAIIEKAKTTGIGMATVKHSNHFGIAGYYAMMALEHNMIGIAYTNTQPLVMPLWGRKIMTGTNPIAVAVPGKNEDPWILDMATSVVPKGKLEVMARKGLEMPTGWAVDKDGLPTNDANVALAGGAPMPLGSTRELGGHKGYDLAALVDIFSGVLSGAAFGPHVTATGPADIGHYFQVIRPDLFMDLEEFIERMDLFVRELKETPPAPGNRRVLVAGEPEKAATKLHLRTGIPVHPKVMEGLTLLSHSLDVPLPACSHEVLG